MSYRIHSFSFYQLGMHWLVGPMVTLHLPVHLSHVKLCHFIAEITIHVALFSDQANDDSRALCCLA